jgi:hypothetical protein
MINEFQGDLTAKAGEVYEYTRVSGYIYASGADTKTAFPKLTSVGGSIYASGADTKTAFPKLTSVGGSIDARGDWSHVKMNDSATAQAGAEAPVIIGRKCRAAVVASFAAAGFSWVDEVLARIISQRGPVSRVVVCGRTDVSYLVTNGEAWSHGKTLSEARDGLLFKIGKRDPAEFKAWTLDKVVSKRDAIRAYRVITGACEGGVRAWMEQRQTPEEITVERIIELTKGAYGADTFREFFAPVAAAAGRR